MFEQDKYCAPYLYRATCIVYYLYLYFITSALCEQDNKYGTVLLVLYYLFVLILY